MRHRSLVEPTVTIRESAESQYQPERRMPVLFFGSDYDFSARVPGTCEPYLSPSMTLLSKGYMLLWQWYNGYLGTLLSLRIGGKTVMRLVVTTEAAIAILAWAFRKVNTLLRKS